MAATVSDILISFKEDGANTVGSAFRRITREARGVEKSFQRLSDAGVRKLRSELSSLGSTGVNTISSMRAQKNALLGLRDMADVTGNEFKKLTADIARLDARMKQATATSGGLKSKLTGMAKGVGSVAAGGIFGGIEGALGAGVGLAVGGAPGAIVGGAIGAQVKMVREQLGGIAEFAAALELQRKALKLVINDTNQFAKSQQFLLETSRKLAIPQSVITRQFTSLTASVVGAGMSVDDAEKAFIAIVSGIRGTGGNLEDMKSAMRAVSQVFSKGKVSAEELRQQLGERLPGAFTLFADSMDMTPAMLDKALEQGKVTLEDFMGFAELLFNKYGDNAELLAASPEAAGDRLRTSLEELNDDLGSLLKPIGMQFQTLADDIVKQFGRIIKEIRKMVDGIATERKLIDALMLTKNERQEINTKAKDEAVKQIGATVLTKEAADKIAALYDANPVADFLGVREMKKKYLYDNVGRTFDDLNSFTFDMFYNYELAFDKNLADVTTNIRRKMFKEMFDLTGDTSFSAYRGSLYGNNPVTSGGDTTDNSKSYEGVMGGIKDYFDSIKKGSEEVREVVTNAFQGMEDAIVKFVMTGKLNFADFTRSILADMARIIVRQAFLKPLLGGIFGFDMGGGGGATGGEVTMKSFNALGNVYGKNGIVPFAKGGTIVRKPTLFPFANGGVGLMAEAGYPEAIMPLKRTPQGKLGVEATGGGGGTVVNVSVNAGGTNAEGNTMKANQLGKLIGTAIEAELIKQKRPGGILYS